MQGASVPGARAGMPDDPMLLVSDLGVMDYGRALALQRAIARHRIAGEIPHDVLLLVEHPHVVTLGRSTGAGHVTASHEALAAQGVQLFDVDRGGDATYHGPGQLVGYPILDLKRHRMDLHWYLRQVEEVIIRALQPFGVAGARRSGYTGVWVEDEKIASIGVHARDWVTWHGFALNVTTDLSYFDLIVPCGIPGVRMTSIRKAAPADAVVTRERVASAIGVAFGEVFQRSPATYSWELFPTD